MGVYVDDFIVFSNDKQEANSLIKALSAKFKIKNLGQVKQYLGMRIQISKDLNVITVDQEHYIEQLLKKFDMSNCNPADTPIECQLNLEKSKFCADELPYQKLIEA